MAAVLSESDLKKIMHGSMEERLTKLSEAVEDVYGEQAMLVSTFDDSLVVLMENQNMARVEYKISDGAVHLDNESVFEFEGEQDVVDKGVSSFMEGRSVKGSLADLVSMQIAEHVSPYKRTRRELTSVMGDGKIWRRYVDENKKEIVSRVVGMSLMPSGIGRKFDGVEMTEDRRSEVMDSVSDLEKRVSAMLAITGEAYEQYKGRVIGGDADVMEAKMHFESLSGDYLEHLEGILGIVSRSIQTGCADCAAMVHDEVADIFEDLELGGRMIQQVAGAFKA